MNNITAFEIEWVTLMVSMPIGVIVGVVASCVFFFKQLKKTEQKSRKVKRSSETNFSSIAEVIIRYNDLITTELKKEIEVLKDEIERLKIDKAKN